MLLKKFPSICTSILWNPGLLDIITMVMRAFAFFFRLLLFAHITIFFSILRDVGQVFSIGIFFRFDIDCMRGSRFVMQGFDGNGIDPVIFMLVGYWPEFALLLDRASHRKWLNHSFGFQFIILPFKTCLLHYWKSRA